MDESYHWRVRKTSPIIAKYFIYSEWMALKWCLTWKQMLERKWSAGKCQQRIINTFFFLNSLLHDLPPTFPNCHYLFANADFVLPHEHTTFFQTLWSETLCTICLKFQPFLVTKLVNYIFREITVFLFRMMLGSSHLIPALAGSRAKPGHLHCSPLGEADPVSVSQPPSKNHLFWPWCSCSGICHSPDRDRWQHSRTSQAFWETSQITTWLPSLLLGTTQSTMDDGCQQIQARFPSLSCFVGSRKCSPWRALTYYYSQLSVLSGYVSKYPRENIF